MQLPLAHRLLAAAIATAILLTGCGVSGSGGSEALAPAELDSLRAETASDRNDRLLSLAGSTGSIDAESAESAYRIGEDDLLDIRVFGVEDLSARTRVTSGGTVSLPLLGAVQALGKTAPELAEDIERSLRGTYMRDPQVSVEVAEMRSHSVSVVGAVNRPGVHPISGARTLLEVLALAEGLSNEAGQSVLVVRRSDDPAGAANAGAEDAESGAGTGSGSVREIDLGALLESGDPSLNVTILPGDVVQVRPAGTIYVVGDVNRPGGFPLGGSEPLSVLHALALAEGLRPTAATGDAVILRAGDDGRDEIPVDLDDVLSGSVADPALQERDILFVPNSTGKSVARGVLDAFIRMATLRGLLY